eukprot:TRINITY_DN1651_c0_g1_i1.p1 TRINITY_DN1651_c0_g1~~TRINITY_DN1651_c0_g1_i1.p1  ORF type:complete len:1035 (+),score=275.07 TRINITY_DN1651_c0_g1_i1:178-3282(+)
MEPVEVVAVCGEDLLRGFGSEECARIVVDAALGADGATGEATAAVSQVLPQLREDPQAGSAAIAQMLTAAGLSDDAAARRLSATIDGMLGADEPACAGLPSGVDRESVLSECLSKYKAATGNAFPAAAAAVDGGWHAAGMLLLSHSSRSLLPVTNVRQYKLSSGGHRGVSWVVRAGDSADSAEIGVKHPGDTVWAVQSGDWLQLCSNSGGWVRAAAGGAGWVPMRERSRRPHCAAAPVGQESSGRSLWIAVGVLLLSAVAAAVGVNPVHAESPGVSCSSSYTVSPSEVTEGGEVQVTLRGEGSGECRGGVLDAKLVSMRHLCAAQPTLPSHPSFTASPVRSGAGGSLAFKVPFAGEWFVCVYGTGWRAAVVAAGADADGFTALPRSSTQHRASDKDRSRKEAVKRMEQKMRESEERVQLMEQEEKRKRAEAEQEQKRRAEEEQRQLREAAEQEEKRRAEEEQRQLREAAEQEAAEQTRQAELEAAQAAEVAAERANSDRDDAGDEAELWDMDCKGADLFVDGVYQKRCGVTFAACRSACETTDGCRAFVHNYRVGEGPNPQWTDGCCWLKTGCPDRRVLHGKRTVVLQAAAEAALTELWDMDCKGADLFVDGVYQKRCGVTFAACRSACETTDGCRAFVHNYRVGEGPNPQWTDGCCWLKTGCPDRRVLHGKRTVVFDSEASSEPPVVQRPRHEHGPSQISELLLKHGGEMVDVSGAAVRAVGGDSPQGEGPGSATDGDFSTKWADFTAAPLEVRFPHPTLVDSYSIVTANDMPERDPYRWVLTGSDDGAEWAVLSRVDGDEEPLPLQRNAQGTWYSVQHPRPYTRYRFEPEVLRGEPWTGDLPPADALGGVMEDTECVGDELVIQGHVMSGRGMSERACALACNVRPGCAVYVYTYSEGDGLHPVWHDMVCDLKQGCSARRRRRGKRSGVVRHALAVPGAARRGEQLEKALSDAAGQGVASVVAAALSGSAQHCSSAALRESARAWLRSRQKSSAAPAKERPLPAFAVPRARGSYRSPKEMSGETALRLRGGS